MSEAEQFAIVMAYEAMRIALGLPTKYHSVEEVIRWMELVAKHANAPHERRHD